MFCNPYRSSYHDGQTLLLCIQPKLVRSICQTLIWLQQLFRYNDRIFSVAIWPLWIIHSYSEFGILALFHLQASRWRWCCTSPRTTFPPCNPLPCTLQWFPCPAARAQPCRWPQISGEFSTGPTFPVMHASIFLYYGCVLWAGGDADLLPAMRHFKQASSSP